MRILPEPVQNLINALERLPGIGPKGAQRIAFYILASDKVAANPIGASCWSRAW